MFWKNEYMIAIYNIKDECLGVVDNAHELAILTNKPQHVIDSMLSESFYRSTNTVSLFNDRCRIFFIPVEEKPKNISDEIWRLTIVPNYIVSNKGEIRRIACTNSGISAEDPMRLFNVSKCGTHENGYQGVRLYSGTKKSGKIRYVHRLVAAAFLIQYVDKPIVNHIDSNPKNNTVENLEWTTVGENNRHAYRHGNQRPTSGCFKPGENSITRKLAKGAINNG